MKNKLIFWIKSILLPVAIGGIVGLVISNYMDYESLSQPQLAPPSIVFPIVWTILYVLMGISYGLLNYNKPEDRKDVNTIYYFQLGVNALWSIIFFVFKWRLFSAFWLIFLIVCILIYIVMALKYNKISGLIQIPYLLWCGFALYLNVAIYFLN